MTIIICTIREIKIKSKVKEIRNDLKKRGDIKSIILKLDELVDLLDIKLFSNDIKCVSCKKIINNEDDDDEDDDGVAVEYYNKEGNREYKEACKKCWDEKYSEYDVVYEGESELED